MVFGFFFPSKYSIAKMVNLIKHYYFSDMNLKAVKFLAAFR